jgi:hypothetical protein
MLVNLSMVTKALVRLLEHGIKVSDGWNNTTPSVSASPPDRVGGEALGLYLYHVAEDTHTKNAAAPSGSSVPVRHAPMGLRLHYQLTAHSKIDNEDSVYTAQQLMGCAVKVLHDYPVVNDDTVVDGTNILTDVGLDGAGNVLRICLQPVHAHEAVSYWTAGTGPTRLSAYYEVNAVLLEPEPLESRSGRVLSYGIQVFTTGAPRLDGSRSTVGYTSASGQPATVELRPAQAAIDDAFMLTGFGLVGNSVGLLLRSASWKKAEVVDTSAWGVSAMSDRVVATVRGNAGARRILPGTYDAAVLVTRLRQVSGSSRAFTSKSNVVPIVVTPRITKVTVTGANTLRIEGEVFQDPDLVPDAVEVHIDGAVLTRDQDGVLAAGEFIAAPTQIDLQIVPQVRRGVPVLIRVLVNGAEAAPFWKKIP